MERTDVLIVGGGIVGLATARAIVRARPHARVVVVEKEAAVALHQSGRNSGVIHAGVYYAPGSEKARLCVAGRASMVEYCRERGIAHEVCGKVIVAIDDGERARLDELEQRCHANAVRVEVIDRNRLRELEPHVAGTAALHVLDTGIVDYGDVCRALAAEVIEKGAVVRCNTSVLAGRVSGSGMVVETTSGPIEAARVVTCAGLHADTVAEALSGPSGTEGIRIMAFRGEYREFVPARSHLVQHLVYPVPDPQFPFLGVHLTRGIDGQVHAGPNAVLAFAREGYVWRKVDFRHLGGTIGHRGFRRFARQNWRFGIDEMARSASRRRFTTAVRRLVPEIEATDLTRASSGVRAQAMLPSGALVDDFAIHAVGPALHVLNAPSPAATASLEIGRTIAARLDL